MYVILIMIIMCFIYFLHWCMNCRKRARIFWKIPGPPGKFLFGNCLEIVVSPVQLFKKGRAYSKTYQNLYRQWIYPYGILNIYDPQDVETVLSNVKYNEKSVVYALLKPWLQDGLLLSKDSKWYARRKILTPAFHFNILNYFTTLLAENSARLAKDLEAEVGNDATSVVPILSDFTLNSLCETSMGTMLAEDTSGLGKLYKKAIHEMGNIAVYRLSRRWLLFDSIFNISPVGRKQKEVLNIIHNFPKKIIEERTEYVKKYGVKIPNNEVSSTGDIMVMGGEKRRMAMLDLLLSAKNDGLISTEGIQEEVDTSMFEGHDTTAMGLAFCLMELAHNKQIQDKVFVEVQEVLGDSGCKATMHDLNNLKYMECCIKESMRLYPPVPFISRHKRDEITIGGHLIPAGITMCNIHIFDLHRRADLYEDPLSFNPDRFLPENCINRHPYAYIPFSAGPRNCIGQRFAMLELKSALVAVLQAYELRPVTSRDNLVFRSDLVLRTTHAIYVQFIKRK